jgi:hypothetical protein
MIIRSVLNIHSDICRQASDMSAFGPTKCVVCVFQCFLLLLDNLSHRRTLVYGAMTVSGSVGRATHIRACASPVTFVALCQRAESMYLPLPTP